MYSQESGIGIDEIDKKKGITNMPAKLEHMCPNYEMWDQWFGSKQKYKPSNVQSNSLQSLDFSDSEGDDGDAEKGESRRDLDLSQANADDGGEDALLDQDGGGGAVAGEGEGEGGGEGEGKGEGDGNGEGEVHAVTDSLRPSPASPLGQQSPRQASPRQPVPLRQTSPQQQAPQRQQQIQQAAAAVAAAAAGVAAAVSTSPSTAAKADKFDATYSAVQHKKIEMMQSIEQSRCANAIALQSRDQVFQAKLVALQQQCKDEDAQAERRLRQRISYETNLSQLLQNDASGQLANDFDRRIQQQLEREELRVQSQGSNASQLLGALLQGLL